MELARLEAVQVAHWSAATSGTDVKAAELVLKISAQRIKLLGLDQPHEPERAIKTIVVGASGDYVGDLRAIAGEPREGRGDGLS